MINHQIPIVWASAELDGAGRKKLHIHLPYRPNNLTQDDCVSLHLVAKDQVFTPPPLPIIGLPEMADIGRYRMSFDATRADGLKYGDVFTGGLLVSSGRCLEWGPLLADMDYANMGVQTIDPSGPVQQGYGGLSHSVGGLGAASFGATTNVNASRIPGGRCCLPPHNMCVPAASAQMCKLLGGGAFTPGPNCACAPQGSTGAIPAQPPLYAPSNVQAGGYGLSTMPYNNSSNRLL